MIEVGDSLDGWTIDTRLGSGPGGPLFRAHRPGPEHDAVVVRVVPNAGPAVVQRANDLCRLDHPNRVRILEVREHAGFCAVVMAFVDGRPLSDLVPPRLPRDRLAAIGTGLLSGLEGLHTEGLWHGDVRPANVRVSADERPVWVDPRLDEVPRPPSADLGPWNHLAPEVLDGGSSLPADIYGFGQILFELATGRPAFTARDLEALGAVKRATRSLDPGRVVSLKMRELVRRATALDPADRPTASELLVLLADTATARPAPPRGSDIPVAVAVAPTPVVVWTDRTGREFRLLAELGRGGFGTVHLAELRTAHGLARRVALKLLHADLDPASQGVARMRDEAHVLVRLDHPVIVAVEDLAEFDGRIGLVVEYVEGQDLSVCIADPDPIPLRAALEVTSQVAAALDEAWRKLQLVHRDVKPANIRIGRHGTVKLLDFGIARSRVVARSSQTQANVLVGSFRYLAPERFAMDDEPEPPSDVFALGCVLFEAATGEQLFQDLDILDLLRLTGEKETLDSWVRSRTASGPGAAVPEPVRALLTDMLAFEAVDRPTTGQVAVRCEQLSETIGATVGLRAWCRSRTWPDAVDIAETPTATPPPAFGGTSPPETPSQSTLAHPGGPAPVPPPGRRRSLGLWLTLTAGSLGFGGLTLFGVLSALLVGVVLFVAWDRGEPPAVPPEPTPIPEESPVTEAPLPEPELETPTDPEPTPTAPKPKRRTTTRPDEPEVVPEAPPVPADRKPVVVRLTGVGITAVQVNCSDGYLRREVLVNGVATIPDVPIAASCLCYFVGDGNFEPRKVAAGDQLDCRVDRRLRCQ